jgi:phage FluMu protein Com
VEALDGNAIAGDLVEVFGAEMTAVSGRCRFCGAISQVAELRVYLKAPGAVARCPRCLNVVLVVTHVRGQATAHTPGVDLATG